MKQFYLLAFILCSFSGVYAATITSTTTGGLWNVGSTWQSGFVPLAGDDVVIADGATVTLTSGAACNSLTVGQGAAGILQYPAGTTAILFTVSGNTTIAAGGAFRSNTLNPAVLTGHTLFIGGDFINNGTFDASASANSKINITFNGTLNNAFTTSATAVSNFNLITIAKTAGMALDFNPSNTVSLPAGFLTLTAATGIFKVSGSQTISNTFFSAAAYTIGANAGLWLNNPNVTVTAQAGIATLNGLLRITQGAFNIGSAAANVMTGALATSKITMEGGVLNAGGRLQLTGTTSAFTQSGGTINIAVVGNNVSNSASFLAAGNFTMSGGLIVLQNKSTGLTPLDYNVSAAAPVITGGTVQLANASTPAGVSFNILGKTPNLTLNNSAGNNPGFAQTGALTVFGDMVLNGTGSFNMGANSLTMTGMPGNPGSIIVNGTGTLTFNSAAASVLSFNSANGNQSISIGSGSIAGNQLPSVTISNSFTSGSVTIPSGLTMMDGTTLSLAKGAFTIAGAGNINFGNGAGNFTCTVADGTMSAAGTVAFGNTGTKTYTYTGNTVSGSYTIGRELPPGSTVTSLTINRAAITDVVNFPATFSLVAGLFNITKGTATLNTNQTITTLTTAGPGNANIASAGNLKINGGTLNVGNTAGNALANAGSFTMTSGAVNVSGRFTQTLATGIYNQSGGTITVSTQSNNGTTNAQASFAITLGTYTVSGGTIILEKPASGGAVPIDYVGGGGTGGATVTITGGVLQVGDINSGATPLFTIRDNMPNLVMFSATGVNPGIVTGVAGLTNVVYGDITLNGTGSLNLALGGIVVKGNYNSATNPAGQPGNLTINNSASITGSTSTTNAVMFASSTGDQVIADNAGPPIPFVTINCTAGAVVLITPVAVSNTLTLTNGIVNSNNGLLTLGTSGPGTLTGGSALSYIDGPFARVFSAGRTATGTFNQTTLYPIGKNGTYVMLYADPTINASGTGTIKLETINDAGPASWVASPLVYDMYKKLSRDWQYSYTGPGTVTGVRIGINVAAGAGSFIAPALETGNSFYLATNPDGSASYTDGGPFGMLNPSGTIWTQYTDLPPLSPALPSGGNFTLATAAAAAIKAPGGIFSNLKLWLKADSIAGSADGSPISKWDNSLAGFASPIQTNVLNQPVFADGASTEAVNFNPSVLFDGSSSYLNFSDVSFTNNLYNIFAVVKNQNYADSSGFAGIGGDATHSSTGAHGILANVDGSLSHRNMGGSTINIAPVGTNPLEQPAVLDFFYGKGSGNSIWYNGLRVSNNTTSAGFSLFAPNSALGNVNGYMWQGGMAEVIMYNAGTMTTASRQQVESYLALKYGASLSQTTATNYTASNGNVIWNASVATAAGNFKYDIFGIGRDDGSTLNQKISMPNTPDGEVLIIATDSNFTAGNHDPLRTSLSNQSFDIFSNNNGPATWTTFGAPGFKILNRQWQVQETGTVGKVYVQVDTANPIFTIPGRPIEEASFYIVTDPNADGDFTDGIATKLNNTDGSLLTASIDFTDKEKFTIATLSPFAGLDTVMCIGGSLVFPIKGSAPTAGTWSAVAGNPVVVTPGPTSGGIANIDFTGAPLGLYNFQYTCLGISDTVEIGIGDCRGPGGVGIAKGMKVWVKADAGVTTSSNQVTQWDNQTPAYIVPLATQASKVASPNVTIVPAANNYNPSVRFTGIDDYTVSALSGSLTKAVPAKTPISFAVAKGRGSDNCCSAIFGYLGGPMNTIIANDTGAYGIDAFGYTFMPPLGANPNLPYVIRVDYLINRHAGAVLGLNGKFATGTRTNTIAYSTDGNFMIGHRLIDVVPNRAFIGDIAEVVNYTDNNSMTTVQKQQVESYLALKWGITLDNSAGGTAGNYMLSDSTRNVWTASVNPTHHNDVIGLARDDNAFLLQKQSRTQDDSLRVFVGDLYTDNQSNPQVITNNLSSIVIGNDKGRLQSVYPVPSKPATIYSRLQRTWKVTNNNFVDKFGVEIKWDSVGDFNLSDIRLLVSDSPDFTNATTYSSYDVDFYIGSIIVKNIGTNIIPKDSTRYFTIASVSLNTVLAEANVNFTAKLTTGNHVALNWQTKNEMSASYFTVERSADKKNWGVVVTVDASMVIVNYNAIDNNPYSGVSYYRLKQTDADGKISYSGIKTINVISNETGSKLLVVYPNPAVSQLTVKGDAADLKSIRIFNVTGQDVTGKINISNAGTAVLSLDISGLSNGVYSIKTYNSGSKFIKQ